MSLHGHGGGGWWYNRPKGLPVEMWILKSGDLFDRRYRILREIGAGGMAHVFAATDEELGETIAIKIIKPEFVDEEEFVTRFKREVRIARQIRHPNVIQVYEFGHALVEGRRLYYLTMELLEGENLRAWMSRRQHIPLSNTLRIGLQLCDALGEAHREGVIHRDIKPQNIFIDAEGQLKLMDFGICRMTTLPTLTQGGKLMGTPRYMSPEQIHHRSEPDNRSDLYAIGVVLYELTTHCPPFEGDNAIELAMRQLEQKPRHPRELEPRVPVALDRVIMTCLEKDPQDRFQTAAELRAALQKIPAQEELAHRVGAADVGSSATLPTVPSLPIGPTAPAKALRRPSRVTARRRPRERSGRRRGVLFGVGAAAAVALLAVVGVLIYQSIEGARIPRKPPGAAAEPGAVAPGQAPTPAAADLPATVEDEPTVPSEAGASGTAGMDADVTEREPAGEPSAGTTGAQVSPAGGPAPAETGVPPATEPSTPLDSSVPPGLIRPPPTATSRLQITSVPEGARVTLDGEAVGNTPWEGELEAGSHRLRVAHPGHVAKEESVILEAGQRLHRHLRLAPRLRVTAPVRISANPGTEVYVDGNRSGRIPPVVELTLETGRHSIRYVIAGYDEFEESVEVVAGKTNEFAHRFPLYGSLRVLAQPYARVFLDGKDMGFTPLNLDKVSEGAHQLRLDREGFETIEQTITVEPAKVNRFSFTLRQMP